jgi:hypothetical protein
MNQRFTLDGDAGLEQKLARLCDQVREESQRLVPKERLEALLLGGGYGRSEGGVLHTAHGDEPYNDLEFYVCLRGNRILNERTYFEKFHHLGETLSTVAGIEVEFKLSSIAKLRRESHTMFSYDLALGHRIIVGDEQLLADFKPNSKAIPLFEATRLLMNRCSGLLFSEERLQRKTFTSDDADFVGRNHAKAQLAFGDVLLTAEKQYHWSCRERHRRLKELPSSSPLLSQVRCHHAQGVEFKLHPEKRSGGRHVFLPLQSELVKTGRELWLWLETNRLQHPFVSAKDYACSEVGKCPETSALRNVIINARRFGRNAFSGQKAFRYPRERLLEALTLLLWEPETLRSPALLARVQSLLQTSANQFPELVNAYRTIWHRFN